MLTLLFYIVMSAVYTPAHEVDCGKRLKEMIESANAKYTSETAWRMAYFVETEYTSGKTLTDTISVTRVGAKRYTKGSTYEFLEDANDIVYIDRTRKLVAIRKQSAYRDSIPPAMISFMTLLEERGKVTCRSVEGMTEIEVDCSFGDRKKNQLQRVVVVLTPSNEIHESRSIYTASSGMKSARMWSLSITPVTEQPFDGSATGNVLRNGKLKPEFTKYKLSDLRKQ